MFALNCENTRVTSLQVTVEVQVFALNCENTQVTSLLLGLTLHLLVNIIILCEKHLIYRA